MGLKISDIRFMLPAHGQNTLTFRCFGGASGDTTPDFGVSAGVNDPYLRIGTHGPRRTYSLSRRSNSQRDESDRENRVPSHRCNHSVLRLLGLNLFCLVVAVAYSRMYAHPNGTTERYSHENVQIHGGVGV